MCSSVVPRPSKSKDSQCMNSVITIIRLERKSMYSKYEYLKLALCMHTCRLLLNWAGKMLPRPGYF